LQQHKTKVSKQAYFNRYKVLEGRLPDPHSFRSFHEVSLVAERYGLAPQGLADHPQHLRVQ
jgi:hypothetical protein